jgi:hypothetical protein
MVESVHNGDGYAPDLDSIYSPGASGRPRKYTSPQQSPRGLSPTPPTAEPVLRRRFPPPEVEAPKLSTTAPSSYPGTQPTPNLPCAH